MRCCLARAERVLRALASQQPVLFETWLRSSSDFPREQVEQLIG